jgi:hypothetical protein
MTLPAARFWSSALSFIALSFLAASGLLLSATPAQAQSPVSTIEDSNGDALMTVFDNGALQVDQLNGFVGINRSDPLTGNEVFGVQADVNADIYGGMYLKTTSPDGYPFYGYSTGNATSVWTYLDGGTNKWHVFNGGDRLTVQSDGNVGVGTTNPSSPLTVNGMIESLSGGLTLPDGTVLSNADDVGFLSLPFSGGAEAPGGNFSATLKITNTKDLGRAGAFINNNTNSGGAALFAETQGMGEGARITMANSSNDSKALTILHEGTGDLIQGITSSSTVSNVRFRVENDGDVLADGTFQGGGADVAEAFDVEGAPTAYEPGDVLTISTTEDRTVTKSTSARSTRVVGVYATKPGVLLSKNGPETDLDTKVPMGVVGVIPTKVSAENGAIERGDLLVTADTPGHAMKAQPTVIKGTKIYPQGAILGKALEGFDGPGTGTIEVLVNVK